ncbi:FAD-binding oxidoreductase [Actinoallomurus sp. CA-150999]|uniref:FAD-binding oxidoreductase n=1 Tax=Actinoallomurus sp. CA-150999 TaxID=3239887 RepID=UPI003D938DA4
MRELRSLQAALDGELITPDSPAYDAARRPAPARFHDVRPIAVVRCASTRDVTTTLAFARHSGTHVVPRGGGHCFAGRSSTAGLVLDLGHLDAVTVRPDGRARIGAGARLAQVDDGLHRSGRAMPAGCGPTVGIAGLTLGGGLGLMGRLHGLTCDALLSAQVVLADGRVVDCDLDREPELFWALRGAGGGQFGVVTSLVFATVTEPRATRFEVRWPEAAAVDVVSGWQVWASEAPDDVTANLSLVAAPGHPLRAVVFGAALRHAEPTIVLLESLAARVGVEPEIRHHVLTWRDLKRSFAGEESRSTVPTVSRSEFFSHPMPASAVVSLIDEFTSGAAPGRRELNFTAMGGAYNRVPPDATAFAHRGERFLLEHVAHDGDHWLERSWALAHAHASGRVYPNFPDPDLDDWATAYHGENAERLRAVKRDYDPERLFRFPQAI